MAAGPTVSVTVTPDTPSAQSTLKLLTTGPDSQSGLPKSLKLAAQKGFQASAPSGFTITVKSLRLSAHAVNGTHSLITNPRSCRRGRWTGSFTLTFSSGSVSKQTSIPCSK